MTDSESLIRQAETQARIRRIFQFGQGLGYLGWIGTMGLEYIEIFKPYAAILQVIGQICLIIWAISLIGTSMAMIYVNKRPELNVLMDDERTRGLSTKAFAIGYWVLLAALAVVWFISFKTTVDMRAIGPVLISLGVAVPSFTYAWLYRG